MHRGGHGQDEHVPGNGWGERVCERSFPVPVKKMARGRNWYLQDAFDDKNDSKEG